MASINGTAVNFGFIGSPGFTVTSGQLMFAGALLQSADQSKAGDVESARNGIGDIVTRGHYDIHDEATLEFIIAGTGTAQAILNTTLATVGPGDFVSITACSSMPDLIATWEIQSGAKISGSNTGFKKASLTVHKRAGVVARAT